MQFNPNSNPPLTSLPLSVTPKESRPLLVVGPTGVGKSTAALALAEMLAPHISCEIIGADAFQVYRELPILTAQPSLAERTHLPHHLIGTVPVSESYDVFRYHREAQAACADCLIRNQLPILVGGTGLYIRALLEGGLAPTPPPNPTLRAKLEALPLEQLVSQLKTKDPAGAERIDLQNPRRVLRALEIVLLSDKPLQSFWNRPQSHNSPHPTVKPPIGVFLSRDRTELHTRIQNHIDSQFARGVIDEVRALTSLPLSRTAQQTLGLSLIQSYLSGAISLATCQERMLYATRQYAKRQLTWFRRQTTLPLLDITHASNPTTVAKSILAHLTQTRHTNPHGTRTENA